MSLITLTSGDLYSNNFTVQLPNNLRISPYSIVRLVGGKFECPSAINITSENDTWCLQEWDANRNEVGWTKLQVIKLRHGSYSNTFGSAVGDINSITTEFCRAFNNQNVIPNLRWGMGGDASGDTLVPNARNINDGATAGFLRFRLGHALNDAPGQPAVAGTLQNGGLVRVGNGILADWEVDPVVSPTAPTATAGIVQNPGGWVELTNSATTTAWLGSRLAYPIAHNTAGNPPAVATLRRLCALRLNAPSSANIAQMNGLSFGIFMDAQSTRPYNADKYWTSPTGENKMFYGMSIDAAGLISIHTTTINTDIPLGEPGHYVHTTTPSTSSLGAVVGPNFTVMAMCTYWNSTANEYRLSFVFHANSGAGNQIFLTGLGGAEHQSIPKEFYKESDNLRVGVLHPDNGLGFNQVQIQLRSAQTIDSVGAINNASASKNNWAYSLNGKLPSAPTTDERGAWDSNPAQWRLANIGSTLGYTGVDNGFTIISNNNAYLGAQSTVESPNRLMNTDLYLEIPQLGVKSYLGDNMNGKLQNVVSPIYIETQEVNFEEGKFSFQGQETLYIDLNNAEEKSLNQLTCRIVDVNGVLFQGLVNSTNITICIKQNPQKAMLEQMKKLTDMQTQIRETFTFALTQKQSPEREQL